MFAGPDPQRRGPTGGRRGPAGSDPRAADKMGSRHGFAGPDPQKKLRRWVMVSAGPDPDTAEVKEVLEILVLL